MTFGFGPSSNVSATTDRSPVCRRVGPKICAEGATAAHENRPPTPSPPALIRAGIECTYKSSHGVVQPTSKSSGCATNRKGGSKNGFFRRNPTLLIRLILGFVRALDSMGDDPCMAISRANTNFTTWQRWIVVLWLVVWIPAYWHTWGPSNFLQLCDIAVILTSIGIWTNSRLLISSQAVSSLLVDSVWSLDAAWRLLVGRHLIGGTEYLFDAHYPLWVRLLSLFHLAMPLLLVWALDRLRYDPRGLLLQCGIALVAFTAARFANPEKNMNFAFSDPFFHRQWGPAPIHIVACTLFMLAVAYLPTHLLLKRLFPLHAGSSC